MLTQRSVRLKLLGAVRHLLVPLVRILLRNGVTFHEFARVSKHAFVTVCAEDFGPKSAASSHGRVSVITGVTRADVGQILRGEDPLFPEIDVNTAAVVNVLQGWHSDPDFVHPYGAPRPLYFDFDPSGLSTFVDLIRRYSPQADAKRLLQELSRIDAIEDASGSTPIRVRKSTYIPEVLAPEAIEGFARGVRRYVGTVEHNLAEPDPENKIFEREVYPDDGIRERDWDTFRNMAAERLRDLVREFDSKFAWFESPRQKGEEGLSVGVGMYVYRDDPSDKRDWEQLRGQFGLSGHWPNWPRS
jgi:hypothetical protein